MDTLHNDALQQLTQLLEGQLPVPPDKVSYVQTLRPKRIVPLGVGYFVRVHPDPNADILGVRVSADSLITITADDNTVNLNSVIATLTSAIASLNPTMLRRDGIYRWHYQTSQPHPTNPLIQELIFDVLYDFERIPTEVGDVIAEIPIELETA